MSTLRASIADRDELLAQRTRERDEALEQQSATSEVLRVISRSPTEIQPVLDAIATAAARLLDATDADIMLVEGHLLRNVARHGPDQIWPIGTTRAMNRDWVTGRAVVDRTTVQVRDLQAAQKEFPEGAAYAKEYGHRTTLATPLLREGNPIGVILIRRNYVRPFTDKQIALVNTFADQAVIAIENTRLLNGLRESLQQQTATADVLKVISSSPGDMKPVFETMLTNALRICEAKFGHLLLYDGECFHAAHLHDVPPAYREYWQKHGPIRPSPNTGLGRIVRDKQMFHIPDLKADAAYAAREPLRVVTVEQAGARSFVGVPMLKEDKLVGAIVIYRQEVRPFTERQIELLKNFAAQAVIAIENTRLLSELRESLQQQTATADVLKVISSSPGELEPVFQAMLENATRICEAKFGTLWLHERDGYRAVAMHGDLPPVWIEQWRSGAIYRPGPDRPMRRATEGREPIQVADMRTDPSYLQGDPLPVAGVEIAGIRTLLLVPMFRESEHVGLIAIYRTEVLPFTEKQIDLVKNFAAQAVIAIENTRLLNELRQRTDDLSRVAGAANGDVGSAPCHFQLADECSTSVRCYS